MIYFLTILHLHISFQRNRTAQGADDRTDDQENGCRAVHKGIDADHGQEGQGLVDRRDDEAVELAQGQVGQDAADEAQEQPFQEERPADEPVRRADVFHDGDFLAPGEDGQADSVGNDEQHSQGQEDDRGQCRPSG